MTSHNSLDISNNSLSELIRQSKDDTYNLNYNFQSKIKIFFTNSLNEEDKSFGNQFSDTQIFQNFINEAKRIELSNIDFEYE